MRTRISLACGAVVAALLPAVVSSPAAHAAVPPIQSDRISMSVTHTLVISADGKLYGAGDNSASQLCGAGGRPTLGLVECLPGDTAEVLGAAAGTSFTLAIGLDERPYAVGENDHGQLTGVSVGASFFQAMTGLPVGVTATAVAAGLDHSLVLGSDGVVYGTGSNDHGQLSGTGDRTTLTALTGLPVGVEATAIAAGSVTSYVLADDGKVYLTGLNAGGGFDEDSLTALAGLPVGVQATAIAAGEGHALVVADNGKAYATGVNGWNQLATNNGNDLGILGEMGGLPVGVTAAAVAAGEAHSVVLGSDGVLYGVGRNGSGQLTGSSDQSTLTAMQTAPGAPVDGIAAGGDNTLKRDTDGIVYGTGGNSDSVLTTSAGPGVNAFVTLAGQALAPVSEPAFAGLARVGSSIDVDSGEWLAPATSYSFQWRRAGVAIGGATSRSYAPVAADVNKNLSVTVTAHRSGFADGSITVSPGNVALGPALVRVGVRPTVAGVMRSGRLLSIAGLKTTSFRPTATSFRYQWLRNGRVIPGATARTYRLKTADKGKLVKVRITALRPGYANGTYVTAARRVAN